MNKLLAILDSSSDESRRWGEIAKVAPVLLAASVISSILLYYFYTINYHAIMIGMLCGIAGSLGHLAVAIHNHRLQVVSLMLLAVSLIVFPYEPRPAAGMVIFNGFTGLIGSFSVVFLLISIFMKHYPAGGDK